MSKVWHAVNSSAQTRPRALAIYQWPVCSAVRRTSVSRCDVGHGSTSCHVACAPLGVVGIAVLLPGSNWKSLSTDVQIFASSIVAQVAKCRRLPSALSSPPPLFFCVCKVP